jgi:hypothetical protein
MHLTDGMIVAGTSVVLAKQTNRTSRAGSAKPELQVEQDLGFQYREWITQRIGWVVIGLVVVAALLGAFGTGPVSSSSVSGPGLQLEYERFGRVQKTTSLRFYLADTQEAATVSISRQYLQSVQVEHIAPEPQKVESDAHWLIYHFPTRRKPAEISFHLKPEKFGSLLGEARLAEGEAISFSQFIYP